MSFGEEKALQGFLCENIPHAHPFSCFCGSCTGYWNKAIQIYPRLRKGELVFPTTRENINLILEELGFPSLSVITEARESILQSLKPQDEIPSNATPPARGVS